MTANPVNSARYRCENAQSKMETARMDGATQTQLNQLGAVFIMEARRYATAIALSASPIAKRAKEQANG
jgi:hypothetical protein